MYLTFEELNAINALLDLPNYLDNARDILIISCFTGQRVSDFMRFNSSMIREVEGKRFIDLTQVKTGKAVSIPIMPEVEAILQKHGGDFPRKTSEQKYNVYIKEVCKQAGINKEMKGRLPETIDDRVRKPIGTFEKWQLVTSHIGRRSFATNFYGKVATTYLRNITGHGSESMFLEYIGKTSADTGLEAHDILMNVKR